MGPHQRHQHHWYGDGAGRGATLPGGVADPVLYPLNALGLHIVGRVLAVAFAFSLSAPASGRILTHFGQTLSLAMYNGVALVLALFTSAPASTRIWTHSFP